MPYLKRFLYALVFCLILVGVIYFVEPPKSWGEASYLQILIFFIPLLLSFTYFVNIFLNQFLKSFSIGLGFLMLAGIKALNLFTPVNITLVLILAILLFFFIPRTRFTRHSKSLTSAPKIPKLRLNRSELTRIGSKKR